MKFLFSLLLMTICFNTLALNVYDVCNSITENTIRLQCLTSAKGYFEERPLRACLSFIRDVDRRDCVNLIVDKTYTKDETISCMMENDFSLRFFCLMIMGEVINQDPANISKDKRIHLMATKALEELRHGDHRITVRILQKLKEMTSPKK